MNLFIVMSKKMQGICNTITTLQQKILHTLVSSLEALALHMSSEPFLFFTYWLKIHFSHLIFLLGVPPHAR
ncbi:hypothetical protein M947_05040 [Sulfurimonas hongkongensis]|uniref:Uncharacterized protein n=1 Tax=Sulfurimonas hongkongensis TaxID=1172190 RepID=T0JP51_9BACT|nr:hypothetical protein [Sulfurimonas hongkongensis]EQB39951.1 hypothetical protein M947_05040 [Sulfurimonas hongkongensis]